MSVKVVKAVQMVGKADASGLNFSESMMRGEMKIAYDAAQASVQERGGVAIGPATVKVLIEQEMIVDDDDD